MSDVTHKSCDVAIREPGLISLSPSREVLMKAEQTPEIAAPHSARRLWPTRRQTDSQTGGKGRSYLVAQMTHKTNIWDRNRSRMPSRDDILKQLFYNCPLENVLLDTHMFEQFT